MNNTNSQSNTQAKDVVFLAGADLTGKEGRLALLVNDGGVPKAALPSAVTDNCPYVILDGAAAGKPVLLRPLTPSANVRVFLKGACNPAGLLVPATGGDAGMVKAIPTAPGTYRAIGFAEEAGVEGQLVLIRPQSIGLTVIAGT